MNVLNKEYQQLEEEIQGLREKWFHLLENKTFIIIEPSFANHAPVIPQLPISADEEQYRSFILELLTLLAKSQPSLKDDIDKLKESISKEVVKEWFKEAIAVNNFYFEKFARDYEVAEWLPFFAAEHAIRPYLQKIAAEVKGKFHNLKEYTGCPACGEAPRVAIINKQGKKEVVCPRCEYTWEVKKIKCAHCGSEEPGKIEILRVEKDDSAELHVCHDCNGYTKVIDMRKRIQTEAIALLDVKSIHLDYIAQEQGFGLLEKKDAH